jgi:hypothetical protein
MKIFLDSGAFSAWTKQVKIDLQTYIDFIQENKHLIETYCNLDDIESAENTWKNQREMERQGLSPMPVYHVGEDERFLKMCMEYPYFGVGGMALQSEVNRVYWFDFVFDKVCPKSNDFFPTHKIHGFGLTSPKLVLMYPWYSGDSTSWVLYGKYGMILIPQHSHRAEPSYTKPPRTIFVSTVSKTRFEEGEHINNVSPMDRELILRHIRDKGFKLGKSSIKEVSDGYVLQENEKWAGKKQRRSVEVLEEIGLSNSHKERDRWNRDYYLMLESQLPKWPWAWTKTRPANIFGEAP